MTESANRQLVDMLDHVWRSMADLGARSTRPSGSSRPSAPGGRCRTTWCTSPRSSGVILGRPPGRAEDVPDDLPHVKNDFGTSNETRVDSRRSWTGADALDEFHAPHRGAARAAPRARRRRLRRRLVDADGPGHRRRPARLPRSSTRGCTNRTCGGRSTGPATSSRAAADLTARDDGRARCRTSSGRKWGLPTVPPSCSPSPARSRATAAVEVVGGRARPLDTPPAAPTVTPHAGVGRVRPPRVRPHRTGRGAGRGTRRDRRRRRARRRDRAPSSTTCSDVRGNGAGAERRPTSCEPNRGGSTDDPGHERGARERVPNASCCCCTATAPTSATSAACSRYLDPEGQFVTVLPARPGRRAARVLVVRRDGTDRRRARRASPRRSPRSTTCSTRPARSTGFARSEAVVGGFSQGGGLALALGAAAESDRARPAGVLAMSPFVATEPAPGRRRLGCGEAAPRPPPARHRGPDDPGAAAPATWPRPWSTQGVPIVFAEYPMGHEVALESVQQAPGLARRGARAASSRRSRSPSRRPKGR